MDTQAHGNGSSGRRYRVVGKGASTLALRAALLLAAVPLGLRPAIASAAPLCFGKPATHVMHEGDQHYLGSAGDDVVVGSSGPDRIFLATKGGNDLACGGGGDDRVTVRGPVSKADGGAGVDIVATGDGALAQGGSGDDFEVSAQGPGGLADGGSGNDKVGALNGATAKGGSGNDTVSGLGAGALYGGSASDQIVNVQGNPLIDCGAGFDTITPNGASDVRRCEQII